MLFGGKRVRPLRIVAMGLAVFSIFSLVAVDSRSTRRGDRAPPSATHVPGRPSADAPGGPRRS